MSVPVRPTPALQWHTAQCTGPTSASSGRMCLGAEKSRRVGALGPRLTGCASRPQALPPSHCPSHGPSHCPCYCPSHGPSRWAPSGAAARLACAAQPGERRVRPGLPGQGSSGARKAARLETGGCTVPCAARSTRSRRRACCRWRPSWGSRPSASTSTATPCASAAQVIDKFNVAYDKHSRRRGIF